MRPDLVTDIPVPAIVQTAVDPKLVEQVSAAVKACKEAEQHQEDTAEQHERAKEQHNSRRITLGELLIKAKDETPHGAWGRFLRDVGINERNAQRYMQFVREAKAVTADGVSEMPTTYHDVGMDGRVRKSEFAVPDLVAGHINIPAEDDDESESQADDADSDGAPDIEIVSRQKAREARREKRSEAARKAAKTREAKADVERAARRAEEAAEEAKRRDRDALVERVKELLDPDISDDDDDSEDTAIALTFTSCERDLKVIATTAAEYDERDRRALVQHLRRLAFALEGALDPDGL